MAGPKKRKYNRRNKGKIKIRKSVRLVHKNDATRVIPTIELYEEYIYAICLVNICICGLLVYKGIKILTT